MRQFEVAYRVPPKGTKRLSNSAVLRVPPFSPKAINEKTYWVTKVEISVRTASGNLPNVVGLIFDKENGMEYALTIDDFNRFMKTGDLSLLPKESTPSPLVSTLQLKELRFPTDKAS
jgi:hypothetical protein